MAEIDLCMPENAEVEVWMAFCRILFSGIPRLPARVRSRGGAGDLRKLADKILREIAQSGGRIEPIRAPLLDVTAAALTSASKSNICICDLLDLIDGYYDGEM